MTALSPSSSYGGAAGGSASPDRDSGGRKFWHLPLPTRKVFGPCWSRPGGAPTALQETRSRVVVDLSRNHLRVTAFAVSPSAGGDGARRDCGDIVVTSHQELSLIPRSHWCSSLIS